MAKVRRRGGRSSPKRKTSGSRRTSPTIRSSLPSTPSGARGAVASGAQLSSGCPQEEDALLDDGPPWRDYDATERDEARERLLRVFRPAQEPMPPTAIVFDGPATRELLGLCMRIRRTAHLFHKKGREKAARRLVEKVLDGGPVSKMSESNEAVEAERYRYLFELRQHMDRIRKPGVDLRKPGNHVRCTLLEGYGKLIALYIEPPRDPRKLLREWFEKNLPSTVRARTRTAIDYAERLAAALLGKKLALSYEGGVPYRRANLRDQRKTRPIGLTGVEYGYVILESWPDPSPPE